ncbi:glycosyltransferase family 4 protein [Methylomonas sp. AM2-LC]|uniref:glycosyltransferase family 4 protein n=1 Tax=Methylomonas sp. AM2-LC TaxID=3153301 RepID=UPI003265C90D
MRIGLLIYGDLNTVSGGYLYNRKLVSYLREQGEQVQIISLPQRRYWQQLGDNFSQFCLAQISAADIDILIQDAMVHPSVFMLNQRLSKQLKIPLIALIHLLTSFDHHPWFSVWFYRSIERHYLKSVAGIIVNSQTTKAQAIELTNNHPPPLCLAVPAGDNFPCAQIEFDAINQRVLTPGPLHILLVGNVIQRKGLHVLLQALRQLPTENFQLTVAGRLDMEPDYVKRIETLIHDSQLQKQVLLKGPVQGQALANLYLQHHIMVLPSAYESYGIVYVEAQQFGLPVIGTRAGAAKEIIKHGDNGYLIAVEDWQALADHLQTLQNKRSLLLELSQNSLAAYSRHPTWKNSCKTIREYLYARLDGD